MSKQPYSTDGFDREVYRIDGVESVVYAIGPEDAPPAVYFHGGGTFHGFEWMRDFADEFRMISPIHPGFGESSDGDVTSMADYVTHYEMLFAALGLENFHLLGASMGGHMAARYAGEHADEIDRLVLVSPAGLKSDTAAIPDWTNISPADMRGMFVESLAWLEPFWPAEPDADWLELRQREGAMAMRMREDPAVTDANTRAALAGFDRPTLLLWGTEDRIVPVAYADAFAAGLRRSETRLIAGGSHFAHLEHADEAVRAITEFAAAQTEPA